MGITYGHGQFVAVGGGGGIESWIFTSPDGITWSRRNSRRRGRTFMPPPTATAIFVIMGNRDHASGEPREPTSPDAMTWTSRTLFLSRGSLHSVAFGNGAFVGVGDFDNLGPSLLITSTDGALRPPAGFWRQMIGLSWHRLWGDHLRGGGPGRHDYPIRGDGKHTNTNRRDRLRQRLRRPCPAARRRSIGMQGSGSAITGCMSGRPPG